MSHLVIVESPAKTAKIQGFLGSGWRVVATMGHIRALKHDLSAVGLDRDFEPTYEWMTQKKRALDQLRDAAKEATDIYLASDDDREGEGIAFAVATLLRIPIRDAKRAVFHEITERAVKHAVEHPRPLDMNKVHSQQARAMLDMLVGFTISPLLWKSVAPSLSAGRCQTPALRLVVDREEEIESFTASSSWAIYGQWSPAASDTAFTFRGVLADELADEESALAYLENTVNTHAAQIQSKDIRPWTERAPPPLITSSLQQQASAMFHINPKTTMSIAQRLYEAGKITYMRTDCAVLSEEATTAAKEWITQAWGAEYVDSSPPKPASASKKKDTNAQEAHEAIRPVHIEEEALEEEDAQWSSLDRQIYRLIRQRTLQSIMATVRGETCSIHFRILDAATQQPDEEFEWTAQWKHTTFDGWRRAGKVAELDEESDEEEKADSPWDRAIQLAVGDSIHWSSIKAEPKETRAKGRFTEATLVRELESKGIGRPSTYASLLSTIQERGYVAIQSIPAKTVQVNEYTLAAPGQWPPTAEKKKKQVGAEKNKVVPTALGRSVLHYLLRHFDDLFAYAFTAEMEKQLDRVAKGETPWKQPLRELWESYRDRHSALTAGPSSIAAAPSEKVRVLSADGNLKAVQSKKGPLLLREGNPTQFIGWPKGAKWDQITEAEALAFEQEERIRKSPMSLGEYQGQPILKREGQHGAYVQCGLLSVTYQDGEPLEQLVARLEAKKSGTIAEFKEYSIRAGQYGPYIMKTSLKKPQFVSLPKGIDPLKLTAKEVENLYRLGMEEKKNKKQKPIPR